MTSFLLLEDLELVLLQFVGLTQAIIVSLRLLWAILLPYSTRSELYLIVQTAANIYILKY